MESVVSFEISLFHRQKVLQKGEQLFIFQFSSNWPYIKENLSLIFYEDLKMSVLLFPYRIFKS